MTALADVATLADLLERAERERAQIPALTASGTLDATAAYEVQRELARRRLARGERRVGMKVGLTSEVMQRALGIDEPDFGHLFAAMRIDDGGSVATSELLQPRIEAEIAVVLGSPLRGPGVTDRDVLDACAFVSPALEIIDSRIRDWKIALADTIADNGSSARFVLGSTRTDPHTLDLGAVAMSIAKNGAPAGSGTGRAVLGSGPFRAVAWLANTLATSGLILEADDVILPGALSAAIPVAPGDQINATFTGLGDVTVSFA
jgi:2-keto-4-pentenoate hydratase